MALNLLVQESTKKLGSRTSKLQGEGEGKELHFRSLYEFWAPGDQVHVRRTTPTCRPEQDQQKPGGDGDSRKSTEGGVRSCIATGGRGGATGDLSGSMLCGLRLQVEDLCEGKIAGTQHTGHCYEHGPVCSRSWQ